MKSTALIALLVCCGLAAPGFGDTAKRPTPSMKNTTPAGHRTFTFAPEGREFLHSRIMLPEDFKLADMPAEEIDFSDPKRFMPLGVATTGYGPLVISVAARPAFDDGTVSEWLAYLCREEGYEAGAPSLIHIGGLPAVVVEATQVGDGITMRMRMVLLENGGRLFQLNAMAPAELWAGVAEKLNRALTTFELAEVRAPRAALVPGSPVPVLAAKESAAPEKKSVAPEKSSAPVASVAKADDETPATPAPVAPTARLTDAEFAELVLAADASSLDPEQKINANLRDRGIGFSAKVKSIDEKKKSALVGAGAIESFFTVPFGWHVIDDGKRVLVFDGGGRMQISINLRPSNGLSLAELGQSFIAEYLEKQPDLETLTQELDGIAIVAVRGVQVEGETLDQGFLLRESHRDGLVFVARATGNRDDIRLAVNLAGDIIVRLQTPAELAAR